MFTFAPPFAGNVRWCNGSTADFGSACLGSNPGRTTIAKDTPEFRVGFRVRKRNGGDLRSPYLLVTTMISTTQVQSIINEHLEGTDMFLVSLNITEIGHIHVQVDGDSGVTIANCIALSKHIEQHLDRDTVDFSLEVSSYGVGSPLILPRQYKKNSGRLVEIHLLDGTITNGRIETADEEGTDLMVLPPKRKGPQTPPSEPNKVRYLYSDIQKALIQVEF
jgi:ribosome maturation factor RimP